MANDNETVAEIKYRIYQHWRGCENCSLEEMDGADLIAIADQFEEAHKRELAAKDDERLTIVANYENVIAAKDAEIVELRDTINMDSASMAGKDAVIADLRRRLKVAEDALDSAWMYADKLPHQWPLPERVRTKMKNALTAIRGEGGAK